MSFAAVFHIQDDANLKGQEYSWLNSIIYFAQLVFQPRKSIPSVFDASDHSIRLRIGKDPCQHLDLQLFHRLVCHLDHYDWYEEFRGFGDIAILPGRFRSVDRSFNVDCFLHVVDAKRTDLTKQHLVFHERDGSDPRLAHLIWSWTYQIRYVTRIPSHLPRYRSHLSRFRFTHLVLVPQTPR